MSHDFIGTQNTQNRKGLPTGILILLIVVLAWAGAGVLRDSSKRDASPVARQPSVPFRELESYVKAGVTWRNIVVDPDIKKGPLCTLAGELHAAFPTTRVRIFTDDKRFNEYMRWDLHYPDPAFPSPNEWTDKHLVGIINRMMDDGKMRWQLYPMGRAGMKYADGDASNAITYLE
jgi:hypothetical protein